MQPGISKRIKLHTCRWGFTVLTFFVSMAWVGDAQSSPMTESTAPLCPHDLPEAIASITDQPAFHRARWGIRIETLATEPPLTQVLYDREGDRFFVPASNIKLLTTAAALDQLGADFRIRTSVYAETVDPNAAVVRVVGRGDPSLSYDDLAMLAQQIGEAPDAKLHQGPIRHIAQLLVDDNYFHTDAVNPNWEWEDVQAGYGAPVNSLILNRNELRVVAYPGDVGAPVRLEWLDPVDEEVWQIVNRTVTVPASASGFTWVGRDLSRPILYVYGQRAVGAPPDESAISVSNPAMHFLQAFRTALEAEGIRVSDGAVADPLLHRLAPPLSSAHRSSTVSSETLRSESWGIEIAYHLSPPLADLLIEANQNSENIYAESLLRQLSVVDASSPISSPLDAGIAAVKDSLAVFGIDPNSYVLADGSGLSRHNLVSPATFVDLLQAMAQHPDASIYQQSLAVAGERGTLRNRLSGTPLDGRLIGKTGGLTGISSLSGYLYPPHHPPLVVSIIVSHSDQPGSIQRSAIDAILLRLAALQLCPSSRM